MGCAHRLDNVAGDLLHPAGTPKNFLRPCTLLLLDEQPAYGYELRGRLRPFVGCETGAIYRTLNTMEDEGLVRSSWERSATGPRRRRYELTDDGREMLSSWAAELRALSQLIGGFLDRYQLDVEAHASLVRAGSSAMEIMPAGRPAVPVPAM